MIWHVCHKHLLKLNYHNRYYFNVIEKLEEDDIYDCIFVVSRFSSLDSIIPIIENNKIKNIVFVGNNISVEKYMNIHYIYLFHYL